MLRLGVLSVSLFAGCVWFSSYFNLFYNAKKYYKEGIAQEKVKEGTGKQNFEKSLEKCALLLKKYPHSPWSDDALFLLGMNNFYLQNYEKAIIQFKEYLEIYPDSKRGDEVKFYQALSYTKLEEYSQARMILRELIDSKAYEEKAMFNLALSYKKEKDYEKAKEYFTLFLEKYKKGKLPLAARLYLGEILENTGKTSAAINWYEDYIQHMPTTKEKYEVMLKLGDLYFKEKNYDKTIKLLKNASGVYGDLDNKINLLVGKAYYLKGDKKEAEAFLKKVKEREEAAEALYYLGSIYEERGKIEKAIAYYDSVKIKSTTSNFYILSLRKKSLLEAQISDKTDTTDKDPAVSQFLLAQTYFLNMEDYKKALEEYEAVIKKYPESKYAVKSLYALGWIHTYKLKDTLGIKYFREILEKYPNTEYAKKAKEELEKYESSNSE